MPLHDDLQKLIGKWNGTCKVWFEPDKLADQSDVKGEFQQALDGRFVRHTYDGWMQGKSRRGEELIAFNSVTKKFQTSWVDSFHMNYAILFSEGENSPCGFSVQGSYDYELGQPAWGWRTEFDVSIRNQLTIIAYNVTPDGQEAKAVETIYVRDASDMADRS